MMIGTYSRYPTQLKERDVVIMMAQLPIILSIISRIRLTKERDVLLN